METSICCLCTVVKNVKSLQTSVFTSIGKMQSKTTFNICIAGRFFYIACLNNDMFRPLYRPSSGCALSYYKANYTTYNVFGFVNEISCTSTKLDTIPPPPLPFPRSQHSTFCTVYSFHIKITFNSTANLVILSETFIDVHDISLTKTKTLYTV